MSLTKLLKAPTKLFRKENISFLIIRRYDIGLPNDNLRYLSVKPSASISVLRQKIWHLLDLPDFCEEVIVLKSNDVELPLTELRKGNDPQKPFILEVWPAKSVQTFKHNMLTMGSDVRSSVAPSITDCDNKSQAESQQDFKDVDSIHTLPAPMKEVNKLQQKCFMNTLPPEYKSSELSCKMSSTSLFFKLPSRKNRENLGMILLKIQDDLMALSDKLTTLEDKIKT
ncbi:uncharacterized protein LOC125229792 [Leguminivora glycinivorella]|uniref:uncharacterized protein LOC125229792 n=1 Tax=Leguminivora glycinivorella TaxID=1035111 RepID=UPI00200FA48D|nr:uncharacterized protein LOC125229792 [Leguminivora glycinivorella]